MRPHPGEQTRTLQPHPWTPSCAAHKSTSQPPARKSMSITFPNPAGRGSSRAPTTRTSGIPCALSRGASSVLPGLASPAPSPRAGEGSRQAWRLLLLLTQGAEARAFCLRLLRPGRGGEREERTNEGKAKRDDGRRWREHRGSAGGEAQRL